MKDANDTTNSESSLSRRAILTSLAAAAVLSGCKSTPEATPAATPSGTANNSEQNDGAGDPKSKAALALWLLFTTRFVSISPNSDGSAKVEMMDGLEADLKTDLSGLPGDPKATIDALIAYLQKSTSVNNDYGPGGVPLPYSSALAAVQVLFHNFGTGQIPGMSKNTPLYTGSCCPKFITDILKLATLTPQTQDAPYECLTLKETKH